jgi:hypothetical protein
MNRPTRFVRALFSVFATTGLLVPLGACGGGGSSGKSCAVTAANARPVVQLEWQIAHTSMDDDPPRPKVVLVVKGAPTNKEEHIDVGELSGVCRLVELGAQPDEPVYGGGVSELACDHHGLAMHVRVVVASAEEIVVRRYEKDGASTEGADALKNVRDLTRLPVPACARFSSEIAQTSDL